MSAPSGIVVPAEVAAGVRRLAAEHGSGLLGVDLVADAGGWRVVDVTPRPDLTALGPPLVEALRAALLGRERVPA